MSKPGKKKNKIDRQMNEIQNCILFIFWICDADLLSNFVFNASNYNTFVMANVFTLRSTSSNTFSCFISFVSQATAIRIIEL